jgi:EAL domain-containing protein (putative c-di-GMP-specific phosphodiesterase class I)/CheY-like chemotaxis protein
VVSVADGRIVECEALARWNHAGDPVGPSEFIPVAEDAGLIGPLGRVVLGEACRQAASWPPSDGRAEGPAVSVNLSPRQLSQRDLARVVGEVLSDTGLAPGRLCVEITESAVVEDFDAARASLCALDELGVRLSLDDFGTGYSSLVHLRRLPFHQLKVDHRFVAGLGREPSDTAIVAGVVGLGHALGRMVVAEGVETESQLAELAALGCELGQGTYWCPPLPPAQIRRWLTEHRIAPLAALPGVDLRRGEGRAGVLVVDDSVEMRLLLRFALEAPGSSLRVVAEAGDGAGAIAQAAALQPDVVVLDLVMGGRGGLEVLPELRRAAPTSRVIVLSGFVSPGIERAALQAGASAYLTKAMPMPEIVARLVSAAMPERVVVPGRSARGSR